jgi:TfoX/Sxy family transcriptional regulator of competence genes
MPVKDLYDAAATALSADHPEIETTRMFGAPGLKTRGKTFAMIVKGELVVKLPRQRVDQLASESVGRRFDPGHGRVMKEWVTLILADLANCRAYMTEALTYVGATPRR